MSKGQRRPDDTKAPAVGLPPPRPATLLCLHHRLPLAHCHVSRGHSCTDTGPFYRHRPGGPQTPLRLCCPRREASSSEQRWAQGLVPGQRPGSGGAVDQVSLLGGGQVPSPASGAGRDHHSATPLPPPRFWPEAVDTERGRPGGAYVQGRRSGVQAKPGLGRG